MNRLFYGILYCISRLPMSVLYVISDMVYFLLNYIIRYRRKVILYNLKKSFPNKSKAEIQKIAKQFYRNFADYLVETLKSFSISQAELNKRHTFANIEVFDECFIEKKDVILMAGHVFNWEWFIGLVNHLPSEQTLAVYHKIRNKFWNERINKIRSRFGTTVLDMKDTGRYMMRSENDGNKTYLFVADQSPKKSMVRQNILFLNQETPVFTGFEKIAVKKNMAVIFCKTIKIKQGHYHTTFERILPDGEKFGEMEVVQKFFGKLETLINSYPDNWLWSHKRWKYKKGIDY